MQEGIPAQNKPDPRGNQAKRARKPATESTCAQGTSECEELYFSDQNCISALFSAFSKPPGIAPG